MRQHRLTRTLGHMVAVVVSVAGAMVWFGLTLLREAWRGSRSDRAAHLAPGELSLADEAADWLDQLSANSAGPP